MLTFERYNRSHLHARRLHVDQEEGDARLLLALCRCTHQAEAHVGISGECGPGLLTIDQIMATLSSGAHLEARQVRACAGFGIALTPPSRTIQNAVQPEPGSASWTERVGPHGLIEWVAV